MIHLDTGFLINALHRGSAEDRQLRRWLGQGEGVGISAVSWTEFLCGPVTPDHLEVALRVVDEPVALLATDAAVAARLFNFGGRRRGSLNDCMIAAIALRVRASLATTNAGDFRRFQPAGLHVVEAGAGEATAR